MKPLTTKQAARLFGLSLIILAALCAGLWLGYDLGYSDGWGEALFEADTVDMELRGVKR